MSLTSHDQNFFDFGAKSEEKDGTSVVKSGLDVEFPFPFEPYDIQLDFMRNLYDALENGKLGIFESPTGTGKSLSLICGALTWLRDHEECRRRKLEHDIQKAEKSIEDLEKAIDESQKVQDNLNVSGLDWLDITGDKCKKKNELMELKLQQLKYEKVDNTIKDLRAIKSKKKVAYAKNSEIDQMLGEIQKMKQVIDQEFQEKPDAPDEDLILREYNSEEEDAGDDTHRKGSDDEDDVDSHITKIYYCSRTHSQLSQFISEVKKSPFGLDARVVPLASRQNSCINDTVLKLKSQSLINNQCIEMQKNKGKGTKQSKNGEVLKKKKTACGCPYFRQTGIETMRDSILVEINEIEDLVKQGRKSKTCPYYSTRHAVPLAQLVVLPYNTLLHKSTREACGILLDGNVVIIDEAHNLLDAVSNIHSCQITGNQLTGTLSQLQQYMERYSSRFTPKNLYYIKQIIFILQILIKFLKGTADPMQAGGTQGVTTVMTLNQFVIDTKIDNLNFYEILRFCKKSEISRKLMGFSEIYQPNVRKLAESNGKRSSVGLFLDQLCGKKQIEQSAAVPASEKKLPPSSPLQQVVEFFRCLNNRNEDGRIFLTRQAMLETSSIKYSLMNPAAHFEEIVAKARAVIVAGGTMQPVEEFSEQLFQAAGGEKDRIFKFSCGHVIPASNLVALALAQGPSCRDFDFSYQNRNSPELKDELGRLLLNVCNVVPGGMVCFFSSYEYGENVIAHWRKSGILQKLEAKKTVFHEPRKANEINEVLSAYSKSIWKARSGNLTGAILFSVVGGKMSEGINFSNDLARCIIMVGMPYPNIKSPELQEKMQYLNANMAKSPTGNLPGQMYYENLCMKAVNQSIGRAIRHKEDYASILLLDKRYARPSVQNALPGWIKVRMKSHPTFGPAFADIRKFFHDKR